jgi:hypothetical protein
MSRENIFHSAKTVYLETAGGGSEESEESKTGTAGVAALLTNRTK